MRYKATSGIADLIPMFRFDCKFPAAPFLPSLLAGAIFLLAGQSAVALPTTSVVWSNFVGSTTPPASALVDQNGITLLTSGTAANNDGAVLTLGYFTGATDAANFSGTFVPLSGPWSNNVPYRNTSIGDADTNASGALGFFSIQTDFDQSNATVYQDIPAVGTRLCVLAFNAATLADATCFNIATNDAWRWKAPSLIPDFVTINLNDAGTAWYGGTGTERRTAIPVASFPTTSPVIFAAPKSIVAAAGEDIALTVNTAGAGPLAFQWFKNGTPLAGETEATLLLNNFSSSEAGNYDVQVSNAFATVTSDTASIADGPARARIVNLSTRGFVGTGASRLIGGFYVGGTGTKTVLIRAVGPTLETRFDLPGVLADPELTIYRASDGQEVAYNDNWSAQPDASDIVAAMTASGAFSLPAGSADAALIMNLPAGTGYTVHVTGVGGATGVALVELYVIDDSAEPDARLINISTRGLVATGSDVLIPGLYAGAGGARRLLIRAVGPTLGNDPFLLTGTLSDPKIDVYYVGQQDPVASNDNWEDGGLGPAIAAAARQVYAFSLPTGSRDAALILEVPAKAAPSGLTVIVSGTNGETGLALAEVYELPAQ